MIHVELCRGLKLKPGKPHKFDDFPDDEDIDLILRISNAALGETIADEGRTVVKITKLKGIADQVESDEEEEKPKSKKGKEGEEGKKGKVVDELEDSGLDEFVLCSLIPGKVSGRLVL